MALHQMKGANDKRQREAYVSCAQLIVAGMMTVDDAEACGFDVEAPMFAVGAAAKIAGIHPQTLRQYDRLGLIVPQRTRGGARRYCLRDLNRLSQAQKMSQNEAINIAGITRILALMEENRLLRRQVRQLQVQRAYSPSVFAASSDGQVVEFKADKVAAQGSRWRNSLYRHLQITARPVDTAMDTAVTDAVVARTASAVASDNAAVDAAGAAAQAENASAAAGDSAAEG